MTNARSKLNSRIGRRTLALFVACAVAPVVILAALYSLGQHGTEERAHARLALRADDLRSATLERVLLADAQLRILAEVAAAGGDPERAPGEAPRLEEVEITAMPKAETTAIDDGALALAQADRTHLEEGKTLVRLEVSAGSAPGLTMLRILGGAADGQLLRARVSLQALWTEGVEQLGTTDAVTAIGLATGQLLLGSREAMNAAAAGDATVASIEGGRYLVSSRELAMDRFHGPDLILALTVPYSSYAGATPEPWTKALAAGLAGLVLAVALAAYFVRGFVEPIGGLQQALDQLAAGDLSARASADRDDELGTLANAINHFGEQIQDRVRGLEEHADVERTILSSMDVEAIADDVIDFACRLAGAASATLSIDDLAAPGACKTYQSGNRNRGGGRLVATRDAMGDKNLFGDEIRHRWFEADESLPGGLAASRRPGQRMVGLPIRVEGTMEGLLTLSFESEVVLPDRAMKQLEDLVDQLTIALSNTRLLTALSAMHDGALTALARTVDAKSTWTLGHSERVTELAIELAREIGVRSDEIETLHRGGLLHDIGKIGVPNAILDKPSRLTDEEFEIVKSHPLIGVRILEPLAAYRDALPIVEQHHERYDGKGYPHGLAGEDIHPNARIFAVADVFDACRSDRPYRPGMDLTSVIKIIRDGAGTQFDPEVVSAFLNLVAARSWVVFGSRQSAPDSGSHRASA